MPRRTLLDDLVTKRICDALKAGNSYAAAARAAGISENTLHEWYSRGTGTDGQRGDEDGLYAAFAKRVDLADLEAEKRALGAITELFSSDNEKVRLDAARWWLERRRREEWAPPKTEAEKPMTPEEADALIAEAARLAKVGT